MIDRKIIEKIFIDNFPSFSISRRILGFAALLSLLTIASKQTYTFNDIAAPLDSSKGHSSATAAQTSDTTNSRSATQLAQRVLHVDNLEWSYSTCKFQYANSRALAFPQCLWNYHHDQPNLSAERKNPILTTLNKWRYLKADFNVRVAFNFTAYTQGKMVMFFVPLGTEAEALSYDLTRAFQMPHCIIDANSELGYTDFTIPFEPIYGAIDMVEGIGQMGHLVVLPYNLLTDLEPKTAVSKVQINLSNVSLSYNNPIGAAKSPPLPRWGEACSAEPSYYQNFPQKDYTHSDQKNRYPTLLARNSKQSSSGSNAGFGDKGPMSLSSMASTWGYLGTGAIDINSPFDTPIMSWPVAPALFPTPPTSDTTNPEYGKSVHPTPLSYATLQANFWSGSLSYKITFTKTALHTGRLRVIYLPFSTLDRYQPMKKTGSADAYNKSNEQLMNPSTSPLVWDHDLMPNVQNFIFELAETNEIEFDIPFHSIYGAYPTQGMSTSGTGVVISGKPAVDYSTLPCILGQILVFPETPLVTQENLTANFVQFNVFHKAGPDFKLYHWNNTQLAYSDDRDAQTYSDTPKAGKACAAEELVEDDMPQTTSQETPKEQVTMQEAPTVEPGFAAFGTPVDSINELISRPVFEGIGYGDNSGKMTKVLDPNNFGSGNSSTPLNYYSRLYRLFRGEKQYLVKTPTGLPTDIEVTPVFPPDGWDPEFNFDFNFDLPDPDLPVALLEAANESNYGLDASGACAIVEQRMKIARNSDRYNKIKNTLKGMNLGKDATPIIYDFYDQLEYVERMDPSQFGGDAASGNVFFMYNVPEMKCTAGSPLFHTASVTSNKLIPWWPQNVDDVDPESYCNFSSELIEPYSFHYHSRVSKDDWFPVTTLEEQFIPNIEETFMYSPTSQTNSNLMGVGFRAGPAGIGKYYTITSHNPYTATYVATPTFDSSIPNIEEPVSELVTGVMTGMYEAFNGPSLGQIVTTPIERDLQFFKIKSVDKDRRLYFCESYSEGEELINVTEVTLSLTEFKEKLESGAISQFTGKMFYDIYPSSSVNELRFEDGVFVDREGKKYDLDSHALLRMTLNPVTHSHDDLPEHTHHDDGSITWFGYRFFPQGRYMKYSDLFHYIHQSYKYYKNFYSNTFRETMKRCVFEHLYDTYPEEYLQVFSNFMKYGKRHDPIKHFWDRLEPFGRLVGADANQIERLFTTSTDRQIRDSLVRDYGTLSDFWVATAYSLNVVHGIYGAECAHFHDILGGFCDTLTENYDPIGVKAGVTLSVSERCVECGYSSDNYLKLLGNLVSSQSFCTDSREVATDDDALTPTSDGYLIKAGDDDVLTGIFSALFGLVVDLVNNTIVPAISKKKGKVKRGRQKKGTTYSNSKGSNSNAKKSQSNDEDKPLTPKNTTPLLNNLSSEVNSYIEGSSNALSSDINTYLSNGIQELLNAPPDYYDWDPNGVFNSFICARKEWHDASPATLRSVGLSVEKSLNRVNNEEASAELLPIPFAGPALSLDESATVESYSAPAGFSTTLNTRLNNFMNFQIPFYNNSNSQRIGATGSHPLPGTSRALALLRVDSSAIRTDNYNAVNVTKDGLYTPWWLTSAEIESPAWGINLDTSPNFVYPTKTNSVPRVLDTATNASQVQLATFAAPNFRFGEFLGIPRVEIDVLPLFKSSNDYYSGFL